MRHASVTGVSLHQNPKGGCSLVNSSMVDYTCNKVYVNKEFCKHGTDCHRETRFALPEAHAILYNRNRGWAEVVEFLASGNPPIGFGTTREVDETKNIEMK